MNPADIQRRFHEVDARLGALIDSNPGAAIEAARSLAVDEFLNQNAVDAIASGVLIDAGIAARDLRAVDEGVGILERLHTALPQRGDVAYSLANGLVAQADFVEAGSSEWYLATADLRRRARRLYQAGASDESMPADIRAQAHTNLGNSLLRAYRLVEAYDCYERALDLDTSNGIALTGAVRALIQLANAGAGDPSALLILASAHLGRAKEHSDRIRELAGEQAYRQLLELLEADLPAGEPPDLSDATEYQRFVARHRLPLAPTIAGLDLNIERWDSLLIRRITERIDSGVGVPPLFAMFNMLKSEYLAARYVAYGAMNGASPESGQYSDTLDYAVYGIQPAMLTLAQRACIDLLDKVAVAASEYLGLPGKPSHIYFTKRWFAPRKQGAPLLWQPEVGASIEQGNTALIALAEVSGDIEAGGFLEDKRAVRNSSTHRFTVLHDLGSTASRESPCVDHYSLDGFIRQLIETLQMTRAVLVYFVEMVSLNEHLTDDEAVFKGQLFVPDHHWIRGKEI